MAEWLSRRALRMLERASREYDPPARDDIAGLFEKAGLPAFESVQRLEHAYGGLRYEVRESRRAAWLGVCDPHRLDLAGRPPGVQSLDGAWRIRCGSHSSAGENLYLDETGVLYASYAAPEAPNAAFFIPDAQIAGLSPLAMRVENLIESDAMLDDLSEDQREWAWVEVEAGGPDARGGLRMQDLANAIDDSLGLPRIIEASDAWGRWWAGDSLRIHWMLRPGPEPRPARVWAFARTAHETAPLRELIRTRFGVATLMVSSTWPRGRPRR